MADGWRIVGVRSRRLSAAPGPNILSAPREFVAQFRKPAATVAAGFCFGVFLLWLEPLGDRPASVTGLQTGGLPSRTETTTCEETEDHDVD